MPAVPLHYLSGLTAPFARPTGTVVAGVFSRWEDMTERLEQEQADIAAQLERLRGAGKEKSVRFRELFARKLTVSTMLDTLRRSSGA